MKIVDVTSSYKYPKPPQHPDQRATRDLLAKITTHTHTRMDSLLCSEHIVTQFVKHFKLGHIFTFNFSESDKKFM